MDIIKRAAQELKERVNKTSAVEKLLDEATSKENWQAHPKTLSAITDYSNSSEEWNIISKYIWERLYKSDKSAVRTYKTLVLVDHLLKNGSPSCIMEFKDELYKFRKLQDYKFTEGGEDRGLNVRQRAKGIVDLLNDKDKLDHERQNAKDIRSKMNNVVGSHSGIGAQGTVNPSSHHSGPKYAGFSSDSYKDSKYQSYSNKDAPQYSQKQGESYDSTEFRGLEKYRKKEQEQEAEKKVTTTSTAPASKPAVVEQPKQAEQPKLTINQIKIQPPSSTGVTAIPKLQAPVQQQQQQHQQPVQQQKKEFDLFGDDAPAQKVTQDNGDSEWGTFQQTQQPVRPQQIQANFPIQQINQQVYQQQPYQQIQHQPQVQQQQPQQQQWQQKQQQVDLFANSEPDLFSDFQTSSIQTTSQQPKDAKNYSKDEFDLINLGDFKKEAEQKQKEKEQKNNNSNNPSDNGFSTLNMQLDSFSISSNSSNFPQSNYSALNSFGTQNNANPSWPMQQQQQPQMQMYGGYPPQNQGYPNGSWPAQNAGGYGMSMPMQTGQYPGYPVNGGGYNPNMNANNFRM